MSADKLIPTIADFKKGLKGKTTKIHNNDYATVALRIGYLRKNLGTAATIQSNIIHQDDKKVIVRSEVFIDGKLVSTGLAEELRAASRINQTSALENAETSGAIVQSDQKLTEALTELDKVSHLGAYNEWLSVNKELMQKVKQEDAYAWQLFLEKFNQIKKNLETKGVIQHG